MKQYAPRPRKVALPDRVAEVRAERCEVWGKRRRRGWTYPSGGRRCSLGTREGVGLLGFLVGGVTLTVDAEQFCGTGTG